MTGIFNGDIRFQEILDVYGPTLVSTETNLDELYFMVDLDNLVKDLALERRLRYRADWTESVFFG